MTLQEVNDRYAKYENGRKAAYTKAKNAWYADHPTEPGKRRKNPSVQDLKAYGYDSKEWTAIYHDLTKEADKSGFVISSDGAYYYVTTKENYYSKIYGSQYVEQNKAAQKNAEEREAARAREAAKTEEQKRQEELDAQKQRDIDRQKRKKETQDREDSIKKEAAKRLKEYQEARDKANAEEKKKQEEYVKARHERLEKEAEARHKVRTEGVEAAKKQAIEDSQASIKNAEDVIKKHWNTNVGDDGMYNGTSKQALDDMKSTVKDIWSATTGGITSELKKSLDGKEEGSLGYAKSSLNTLFGGLNITDPKSALAALNGGMSEQMMVSLSQQSMLDLQKDLTSGMLTQQIILDSIANRIQEQGDLFKQAGNSVVSAFLIQKAYINAYLKETFGNPVFMKEVHGVVTQKIDVFVDTLTAEKLKELNDKADKKITNTFTRIDKKVTTTTKKINLQLDKITKVNILDSMNDMLSSATSMNGLINKMNKNPLLKMFTPIVSATSQVATMSIMAKFYKPSFVAKMAKVQSKVIAIQAAVNKAKEYVEQKTAQLKAYVNELKQKAMNAITSYATKIVNDIKSKISVSLAGAMGVKL